MKKEIDKIKINRIVTDMLRNSEYVYDDDFDTEDLLYSDNIEPILVINHELSQIIIDNDHIEYLFNIQYTKEVHDMLVNSIEENEHFKIMVTVFDEDDEERYVSFEEYERRNTKE